MVRYMTGILSAADADSALAVLLEILGETRTKTAAAAVHASRRDDRRAGRQDPA